MKVNLISDSGSEYEISISNGRAGCTCEAGSYGMLCKHLRAVLTGKFGNMQIADSVAAKQIAETCKGQKQIVVEIDTLESEVKVLQGKIKKLKGDAV